MIKRDYHSWTEKDSKDNAKAIATRLAPYEDQSHYITSVAGSFDGTATDSQLVLYDENTEIARWTVPDQEALEIVFYSPIKITPGHFAALELDASGTGGTTGTVTMTGYMGSDTDKYSIVEDGTLTESATFTGPAGRTYFDSDGIMQTVAANEARTTYIGGNPYLWIDGAVEEISGRSHDLTAWVELNSCPVAKDAVGLDGGANTAFTLTDDDGANTGARQLNTGITSSTSTYYMVLALKKNASATAFPFFRINTSGATGASQSLVASPIDGSYVVDQSEGKVEVGPVTQDEYFLYVLSVPDNGSGNTTVIQQIRPAQNDDGTTTADGAVTGSNVIGYSGLFKDNFSLMPILTTGSTTKSLATEVASLTNSIISSLTEGTIYMEVWSPQLTSNAARHIAELKSDASNFIRVLHAADGDLDAQITDGGASQAALAGTDLTVGQLQKVALAFDGNDFALYRDGTQEATDSGGTVPSVDTLLIGAGLYGGIKTMNVYTSRLPNSQLASLTT